MSLISETHKVEARVSYVETFLDNLMRLYLKINSSITTTTTTATNTNTTTTRTGGIAQYQNQKSTKKLFLSYPFKFSIPGMQSKMAEDRSAIEKINLKPCI